ncbi:MAG: universal stress protein [Pseudomonadota bacterium]
MTQTIAPTITGDPAMAIRDIIVHIDSHAKDESDKKRQGYARSMARVLDAHLTGLAIAVEPVLPPMVMGEVPASVLDTQRERLRSDAEDALQQFAKAAEADGLRFDTAMLNALEASASQAFAIRSRTSDLAILGQEQPEDGSPMRTLLIESALFESGRPVLIVPYIGPDTFELTSCLVAWDGSREAARSVHEALPLLERAHEVNILVVDTGQVAEDDAPGTSLAAHLARHDLDVTIKTVPAGGLDVASAILSYVDDTRPDLVVMGGYGHSRLREFLMGGATRGMLRSMTAPVLMAH